MRRSRARAAMTIKWNPSVTENATYTVIVHEIEAHSGGAEEHGTHEAEALGNACKARTEVEEGHAAVAVTTSMTKATLTNLKNVEYVVTVLVASGTNELGELSVAAAPCLTPPGPAPCSDAAGHLGACGNNVGCQQRLAVRDDRRHSCVHRPSHRWCPVLRSFGLA